jgi:hypothetical protein
MPAQGLSSQEHHPTHTQKRCDDMGDYWPTPRFTYNNKTVGVERRLLFSYPPAPLRRYLLLNENQDGSKYSPPPPIDPHPTPVAP